MSDTLNLSLMGILAVRHWHKIKNTRKEREFWSKPWFLKRDKYSHVVLLNELKYMPVDWNNYLRMDEDTYNELLALVKPLIERKDTVMRQAITPHERLTATLRFLATGRTYECMKFSAIISPQSLGRIIPETCEAIIYVLKKEYLKFPSTTSEWKSIADEFAKRWNFPGCCGAVDGKHVHIIPPPNSGSYFFNYKGYHSLVLMAVANANYEFIYVHFGVNGRNSDGGVLRLTDFYEKLQSHTLNLPEKSTKEDLPYVFVGDEAFSLREDFMKPYGQSVLNKERRIFNYRLSRARRIIENVFGILVARFAIFRTPINLQLHNVESVVMAACVLHNFLRTKSSSYSPPECFDEEDLESGTITSGYNTNGIIAGLQNSYDRHASTNAVEVRNNFLKYFNNEGRVDWQDKFT